MQQAGPPSDFSIRPLILTAFLPTLLFSIGQGAVIPILPLFATELGASVAVAGLIVAIRGFGTAAFDVPAGTLVDRFGERWTLVGGSLLLVLVAFGAAVARVPWHLGVLTLVVGAAWAIFMIARLSYITEITPLHHRGRALSILGGINRVGNFVGPFIGGYVGYTFGMPGAFYVQAILAAACALLLFFVVKEDGRTRTAQHGSVYRRLGGVVHDHARVFATAGVVTVALQVVRSARLVVLPLWGDAIGLDLRTIGIVVGLSSAIDMVMFYPVGVITDRFGRKWVAVPCLLVMALAMALIPFSDTALMLTAVGLLGGIGNGLGSGIVMTLGADFSPPTGRGEFLGVWRLIGDLGGIGGPIAIGSAAGLLTLGGASVAVAFVGVAGAALMVLTVPEPLHHHARQARDRPPVGVERDAEG
ncbi:MAG: MFS transporter [Dehalococcoidia bacterium]